jgi:hypothetical protein
MAAQIDSRPKLLHKCKSLPLFNLFGGCFLFYGFQQQTLQVILVA